MNNNIHTVNHRDRDLFTEGAIRNCKGFLYEEKLESYEVTGNFIAPLLSKLHHLC